MLHLFLDPGWKEKRLSLCRIYSEESHFTNTTVISRLKLGNDPGREEKLAVGLLH